MEIAKGKIKRSLLVHLRLYNILTVVSALYSVYLIEKANKKQIYLTELFSNCCMTRSRWARGRSLQLIVTPTRREVIMKNTVYL